MTRYCSLILAPMLILIAGCSDKPSSPSGTRPEADGAEKRIANSPGGQPNADDLKQLTNPTVEPAKEIKQPANPGENESKHDDDEVIELKPTLAVPKADEAYPRVDLHFTAEEFAASIHDSSKRELLKDKVVEVKGRIRRFQSNAAYFQVEHEKGLRILMMSVRPWLEAKPTAEVVVRAVCHSDGYLGAHAGAFLTVTPVELVELSAPDARKQIDADEDAFKSRLEPRGRYAVIHGEVSAVQQKDTSLIVHLGTGDGSLQIWFAGPRHLTVGDKIRAIARYSGVPRFGDSNAPRFAEGMLLEPMPSSAPLPRLVRRKSLTSDYRFRKPQKFLVLTANELAAWKNDPLTLIGMDGDYLSNLVEFSGTVSAIEKDVSSTYAAVKNDHDAPIFLKWIGDEALFNVGDSFHVEGKLVVRDDRIIVEAPFGTAFQIPAAP